VRLARRSLVAACAIALACALAIAALAARGTRDTGEHELVDPYQASQQTDLAFGERSHWLQPWRGYLDTVPASRLVDALGMNFNVPPNRADLVAKELAAAGIRRARIEVSWCRVTDTAPARLTQVPALRTTLQALQRNHLRPLVLLNAHHGCPGPLRQLHVRLTAAAPAGARQVTLDSASIRQIQVGHTGLDQTTKYKAAAFLFTHVAGNTVTLSKPLDRSLPAGSYAASTLRYVPFGQPGSAEFERTMQGWLAYTGLVAHTVKAILGNDHFDMEVWNELSFGSDFLDLDKYYNPPVVPDSQDATEAEILKQTVAYLRDPSNGVSGVGIGDGFASLRPFDAGSNVPPGLSAIDKHPYPPRLVFPHDAVFSAIRPVDALGRPEGVQEGTRWRDSFIPSYTAFFPEYFLSGIQTETVIRDLSPITTSIYSTPHGRTTHPPDSTPPAIWLTEAAMNPAGIPRSVLPEFHAKGALRWATAWVNKGASAVYFYAASSPGWGLVNASAPGGGETLTALKRLTQTLETGASPISQRRSLTLLGISDTHNHEQFAGDGTTAHPPLYDRDVVGFFPYQVSNGRVVVATYVMTRDLMHSYTSRLRRSDPRRYDMPPESFRLTIGGVAGLGSSVSLVDPLTGRSGGAHVVSNSAGKLVVDVSLTDSPRLLVLSK
jgi:hypothetical protein